jgi:hypothetical protein
MNKQLLTISFIVMSIVCALTSAAQTIKKVTAVPNPTGLQMGFWEVFNKEAVTLKYFGKRPTSRVDFKSWKSIETSAGHYNFDSVFNNFKLAHDYGETVLGAVNVSFSDYIVPGSSTIPDFYPDSITNPTTRAAALAFIDTYVRKALVEVGNLTLTIDYEIVSNYRLYAPGSQTRATKWANWYEEAVHAARVAAASMGMSANLKIEPIVNGNPFDPSNPISQGPSHNNWLVRAVDTSDYLAFDTYQSDTAYPNNSAQTTMNIIKFWVDSFSRSKQVIITENGFDACTSILPGITRADRNYKTTGTEADQDTFYRNLFSQFSNANKTTGAFKNKIRSYNMWSIIDNTAKDTLDPDRYFGLIGILHGNTGPTYEKQALPTVQAAYAAIETDTFSRPVNTTTGSDSSSSLLAGHGHMPLSYNHGNDYSFIRYNKNNLPTYLNGKYFLHVITANTGYMIIHVTSGSKDNWNIYGPNDTFTQNIGSYCTAGANTTIDLYFTNDKFPFAQMVSYVKLDNSNSPLPKPGATTAAQPILNEVGIVPNPAGNVLHVTGLVANKDVQITIYNEAGKLMLTANNATDINTTDLPAGLYILKARQDKEVYTRKFIKE